MRIAITADLHWNHAGGTAAAVALIDEIVAARPEAVLVIGDVGVGDGDSVEACLSRFVTDVPRWFVPGNHELWTRDVSPGASLRLLEETLAKRVESLGWHWLPGSPVDVGDVRVVGSIGWYDYAFAERSLGIPERFYAAKVSPGYVRGRREPSELIEEADALSGHCSDVVARWNDGRMVKLGIDDGALVTREIDRVRREIESAGGRRVIAAIHTVPWAELLPPRHAPVFHFARAYLGSPRWGEMLASAPGVATVVCGHSHVPMEATIAGASGPIRAINVGCGYRVKRWVMVE